MASKMIKCKCCSNEIANSAKSCPSCGAKNKKPIYKKLWFWVVIFIVFLMAFGGNSEDPSKTQKTNEGQQSSSQDIGNKEDITTKNELKDETKKEVKEESVSKEFKAALKSAETYSNIMNMSKAEIYDQLVSEYGENFPKDAAQYAIDNIKSDWKENALKTAEIYLETMNMSNKAIFDQLTSEHGNKFTKEEAQYAIDNLK